MVMPGQSQRLHNAIRRFVLCLLDETMSMSSASRVDFCLLTTFIVLLARWLKGSFWHYLSNFLFGLSRPLQLDLHFKSWKYFTKDYSSQEDTSLAIMDRRNMSCNTNYFAILDQAGPGEHEDLLMPGSDDRDDMVILDECLRELEIAQAERGSIRGTIAYRGTQVAILRVELAYLNMYAHIDLEGVGRVGLFTREDYMAVKQILERHSRLLQASRNSNTPTVFPSEISIFYPTGPGDVTAQTWQERVAFLQHCRERLALDGSLSLARLSETMILNGRERLHMDRIFERAIAVTEWYFTRDANTETGPRLPFGTVPGRYGDRDYDYYYDDPNNDDDDSVDPSHAEWVSILDEIFEEGPFDATRYRGPVPQEPVHADPMAAAFEEQERQHEERVGELALAQAGPGSEPGTIEYCRAQVLIFTLELDTVSSWGYATLEGVDRVGLFTLQDQLWFENLLLDRLNELKTSINAGQPLTFPHRDPIFHGPQPHVAALHTLQDRVAALEHSRERMNRDGSLSLERRGGMIILNSNDRVRMDRIFQRQIAVTQYYFTHDEGDSVIPDMMHWMGVDSNEPWIGPRPEHEPPPTHSILDRFRGLRGWPKATYHWSHSMVHISSRCQMPLCKIVYKSHVFGFERRPLLSWHVHSPDVIYLRYSLLQPFGSPA
ncbi:unnamed protein product [Zymoseptoria tritici ST99CH_1A5]|uniref:Uncharacterized protein n=1 Tax=Zymoseptoria tritici ST99CH_1A5 TaxID=1276529 RepID=A0A1Y6M2N1_ZYMTR|nr:unnamed protein product [Zymoseptoria tritici ST99CH_1A5]